MKKRVSDIDERIEALNTAAEEIAGITKEEDLTHNARQAIVGISTILASISISLVEATYALNRLADQGDRNFEEAVKAEAENLAAVKHEEETKRSFIGKK